MGAFDVKVRISGSIWKGAEMAGRPQPGKGWLRYCYMPAEE